MKKRTSLIVLATIIAVILFFLAIQWEAQMRNQEKEISEEIIDFNRQVENLSCGKSFFISEMTHGNLIYEFKEQIKKKGTIVLGKSKYTFISNDSSNNAYKNVYLIQNKKDNYLIISIYTMEIAPGRYRGNFIDVECKCE